jgi:putative transposase
MKVDLRESYGASTRAAAEAAIDVFADKYGAKYDKAVPCLTKVEMLCSPFSNSAEHWDHPRTSNPIESVFATVRHRTVRTKRSLSATTAKLMVRLDAEAVDAEGPLCTHRAVVSSQITFRSRA